MKYYWLLYVLATIIGVIKWGFLAPILVVGGILILMLEDVYFKDNLTNKNSLNKLNDN